MTTPENEFECSDCGAGITRQQTYCPRCGARIEWDAAPALVPEAQAEPFTFPPLDIGDIFSRTVQLTGRTFVRYLPVVGIVLIPICVLFTLAMDTFYSGVAEVTQQSAAPDRMQWPAFVFVVGIGLLLLAYISGMMAVTLLVRREVYNMPCTWQEALKASVGGYLLRGVGVMILIILAIAGLVVVLALVSGFVGAFSGMSILALPLMIFGILMALYIGIRWSLALSAVVCEDLGVTESLGRSWSLVRGSWWRVFGIMMFMGLVSGFAVMLVSTPLTLFGMWDFYKAYFTLLRSSGGDVDPQVMSQLFDTLGIGIGLSSSLNIILSALISPIYTTLLYFDLRARNGEFTPPPASSVFTTSDQSSSATDTTRGAGM